MDVWGFLLFLLAAGGHAAVTIRSHNFWYGSGLGRKAIDGIQFGHALILVAGPILFWHFSGFDPRRLFNPSTGDLGTRVLAGYVVLCWIAATVVMPLVTVARLTRRCPALVREQSTVLSHDDLKLGSEAQCGLAARLPYNEILSVDLDVKVLAIPTLPAEWEGLTVLHLSDLHFCGTPGREFFEKVAERCMEWRPDVVALTGDYVDDREQHAWLSPVFGKLHGRETSVAILGNHDYWYEPEEVRRQLADLGFRTPINAWEVVTVRGKPMVVIGHEGPWQRPAPDLSGCPAEAFRLCLSHTPDNIVWAREHRIDLMLSGHVHGGQIRFPLLGSVVVPSKYGRRYDCGTFQEGGTVLHVSRGLGGQHPLRFFCRPEATLLVLQRTAPPGGAA